MIAKIDQSHGNTIGVVASGKLTHEDYQWFAPQLEDILTEYGTAKILLDMEDFHGWEPKAAWEDLIFFGFKHNKDIERVAMVGDKDWERWLANASNPFMHAEMKYFEHDQLNDAWHWVDAE